MLNERKLTKADIKRWVRQGKSIKAGNTWYTVMRSSNRAEKLMMVTSDWELERGHKPKDKMLTFDDLIKNVNNGSWMIKINDKPVGSTTETTSNAVGGFRSEPKGMIKPKPFCKRKRRKERMMRETRDDGRAANIARGFVSSGFTDLYALWKMMNMGYDQDVAIRAVAKAYGSSLSNLGRRSGIGLHTESIADVKSVIASNGWEDYVLGVGERNGAIVVTVDGGQWRKPLKNALAQNDLMNVKVETKAEADAPVLNSLNRIIVGRGRPRIHEAILNEDAKRV